jgi:hypothetical protein
METYIYFVAEILALIISFLGFILLFLEVKKAHEVEGIILWMQDPYFKRMKRFSKAVKENNFDNRQTLIEFDVIVKEYNRQEVESYYNTVADDEIANLRTNMEILIGTGHNFSAMPAALKELKPKVLAGRKQKLKLGGLFVVIGFSIEFIVVIIRNPFW